MLWQQKGIGGKRVVRQDISTSSDYENKLKKLAVSCEMPPFRLGSLLINCLLDSPYFVEMTQKFYNTEPHYRVKAERDGSGKIIYQLHSQEAEPGVIRSNKSKYLDFKRDKKIKLSFTNEEEKKLSILAKSCNFRKAEMAAICLHFGLDSSQVIMYFQDRYNRNKHYWVTPLEEAGQVSYLLSHSASYQRR
jgi:hypothetical protein